MAEVASAFVSLLPSAKNFGSKLDSEVSGDIKSSGKKHGKLFGGVMLGAAGAAIGGAVALGGFLKGAVGEARDAQKVGALTNAVIKSTGGIANVTAKDVDRLATSISLKTGVDDEAIAAGQNMLLTFGNVRNEVGKGNDIFNQATVAATDMAAAFGGDAVSNSKMLGKALNDPTKGVSALTRVGVSFTQGQKDQIKAMQASGNIMGAQKIILGELTKQTGGAAVASATAGEKFKTAFGNLQESVGTALLPLLDKVLVGMTKFAVFLTNDIGPGIAALNGYLAPAFAAVGRFFSSIVSGSGQAGGLVTTLRNIGTVIAANFLPVLRTAAATFTTVVVPAILRLAGYLAANLIPILRRVGVIIATQVLPIVSSLARFFYGTLVPAFMKTANSVATQLKPVLDQLWKTINSSVLPAAKRLLALFYDYLPAIKKVVSAFVKIQGTGLLFAATILGKVLPPLIRLAGFMISNNVRAIVAVVGALAKAISFLINTGKQATNAGAAFGRFSAAVSAKVAAALAVIRAIPGKVRGALAGAGSILYSAGAAIIQGLINGVSARIGALTSKLHAITSLIPKHKGPIAKDKKLLKPAGKAIMDGLIEGLQSKESNLVDKLDNITSRFEDLTQTSKDFAAGIADKFRGDLFTGGLKEFDAQLQKDTQNANTFAAQLALAASKGLSGGLYQTVAESGNVKVATELAALTKTQIAAQESLFNARENAAKIAGQTPADRIFAKGIADTSALLSSVKDELQGVRADLARAEKRRDALQAAADKTPKIVVNDKSGSPKKTAKEVARHVAHAGKS